MNNGFNHGFQLVPKRISSIHMAVKLSLGLCSDQIIRGLLISSAGRPSLEIRRCVCSKTRGPFSEAVGLLRPFFRLKVWSPFPPPPSSSPPFWLWLKKPPKWNPGKWKHGPNLRFAPRRFILSHTHLVPFSCWVSDPSRPFRRSDPEAAGSQALRSTTQR